MPKYSSTTNSVSQGILACLILLVFGFGVFSAVENIIYKIIAIVITSILVGLLIYYVKSKSFSIVFKDTQVIVEYSFNGKTKYIDYSNITELKYIKASKSPTLNEIKFKDGDKNLSLKFLSIEYSNYIEFVKWIKSKNETIELTVFPSDNYMNHKLQEIYGFKYR